MSDDHFVFTNKWQSRVKALTLLATVGTLIGCLTADWELYGDNHVFSGIKPSLKRYFNDLYGITPASAPESPGVAAGKSAKQ